MEGLGGKKCFFLYTYTRCTKERVMVTRLIPKTSHNSVFLALSSLLKIAAFQIVYNCYEFPSELISSDFCLSNLTFIVLLNHVCYRKAF